MNSKIEYRIKFSYALFISLAILALAIGSVLAGLSMEISKVSPIAIIVLISFYIFYVLKVLKDDSGGKGLQLAISTATGAIIALAVVLFGGVALAVIGFGLFGILGAYSIWIILITRQPIIAANHEKLMLHNGFLKGRYTEISWDEIDSLSIGEQNLYAGNEVKWLVVKLLNPEQFKLKNNRLMAKNMAINEKMYGGHLVANTSHLEADVHEILSELNGYLKRS